MAPLNLLKRLILPVLGLTGARIAGAAFGFLSQMLLAWALPAHDVGLVFFAMSIMLLASLLITCGYPTLALTQLARYFSLNRQSLASAYLWATRRDMLLAAAFVCVGGIVAWLFLPLPHELDALQSFEHDVNLGTADTVKLFDTGVADEGLKRRGLFYMNGAERMYLPAELRGHGLPASLTFLTQSCFGLDLRYADFCDRTISLPIILADGNNVFTEAVKAYPTHDGYFVAAVPIGDCRFAVGVQFGRLYDWVQIESVQFVPVCTFLSKGAARAEQPVEALPSLEGMEQVAPYLMRCEDEAAFMMVPPPPRTTSEQMMLAVVFRPIAERQQASTPVFLPADVVSSVGAFE